MKRLGKSIIMLILTLTMVLGSCMTVFASSTSVTQEQSYINLLTTIQNGKVIDIATKKQYDFSGKTYKRSNGGYAIWSDLVNGKPVAIANGQEKPLLDNALEQLTSSAKQDFVADLITLANVEVSNTETGNSVTGITSETVARYTESLQQQSGLGSTLLASLMQNTKPDYVTANRMFAPFSGPIGVALGLLSIAVMALLGLTMALDIAYITIPGVQMALGSGEAGGNNGNGEKPKGLSGLISIEAKKAVDMTANGGGNGQGGSGEYKAAIGQYFKFRWKGLVMLVICLLYLVQGEIYSFIGWFIDLFSGFLGG